MKSNKLLQKGQSVSTDSVSMINRTISIVQYNTKIGRGKEGLWRG